MAYVSALVPMAQGVSVYAALERAADTCGDGRGRGQVMADTLVERVTGRPADVAVAIAVELVLSDETLLAGDTVPARRPGYGPTSGVNGLGECAQCNYAKEAPGWVVTTACDEDGRHTAEFTTPTRARHLSTTPPLPGLIIVNLSEMELHIGIDLAMFAAEVI